MTCQPDLIFDIGSHKGEDTDFYLKKAFKVVAFEANPKLIAHCKTRFADAIADRRLRIVEGAIAPEAAGERIVFYANLQASVWGTIGASWAERNRTLGTQSVRVEVERVDIVEAFRTYGVPFYLKIDIEGADCVVLEGLRQLEGRPRYISIEAEKVDFARLVAELRRSGVPFRVRHFESKIDFAGLRENVIVNCTGYGAKAIMNDNNLIARRGHLVVLKKTLHKQFYFFSGGCWNGRIMYVFCRQNDIVVGGTVQRGNESEAVTESDRAVFERILSNAQAMFDGRVVDCVTA